MVALDEGHQSTDFSQPHLTRFGDIRKRVPTEVMVSVITRGGADETVSDRHADLRCSP